LPTLEQRMDDLRTVMEAVGSSRAAIVGISEGGPMSALFAATYPEKTLGLVMLGSYARRLRDKDYPWGPTFEQHDEYCKSFRKEWGGPVGIEARAPSLANDAEFRTWWATYLRMGASPGAAEALTRMNAEIDVRPILSSINVPALIVHRSEDKTLLVEEGRFLSQRIPGAKFLELPGADHLPFVGNQEEILGPVEEFLTGLTHEVSTEKALATALFLDLPEGIHLEIDNGNFEAARYLTRIRREMEWFRGREADIRGGAPLATFDGPARAVRCAFAMVSQATSLGLKTRAAVHTGECEFSRGGIPSGFTIQLTGKMLPATDHGKVIVSRVVKDLVAGSGIQFGSQKMLRTNEEDWPLFEVVSC
jgi:hypothetical protein